MSDILIIFSLIFSIIFILSHFGVVENNKLILKDQYFKWNKYYIFCFFLLILFLGTRVGVGRDFYNYQYMFESETGDFEFGESTEIGYVWLSDFLNFLNFDFQSIVLVTSIITVLLLFKSVKTNYQLLPIVIFVFFLGGMFTFSINGIRQGIAMLAFYNALRFIDFDRDLQNRSSNYFWFSFYLLFGALFHYSIFIITPIILILNKRILNLFSSKILLLIIIIGFTVNSVSFLEIISNKFIEFFPKYEYYSDPESDVLDAGGFGIGALFILLLNIFPIFIYDKIKVEYPESRKYFVLFTIGTSLMYAFSRYMMLSRIIIYLSFTSMYVYAFVFSYIRSKKNSNYFLYYMTFFVYFFMIVRFIFVMPQFMELQITENEFSLLFLPLNK